MGIQINTSEIYLERAEELRKLKNYNESLKNYLLAILTDRQKVSAYIGAAYIYKDMQRYDKAIKYLKQAEEIEPNNGIIQKDLAMLAIIEGNFEISVNHLIKSIAIEPNNPDIQMQLALVHEMIEEEEMALMIYQKIIETNPEYIRAYIQKATLYMYLNDYLNAAKLFKKIIQINPEYNRAILALGICYEKMNNISGAKRFYKKYLDKNPLECEYFDLKYRLKELKKKSEKKENNLKIVN